MTDYKVVVDSSSGGDDEPETPRGRDWDQKMREKEVVLRDLRLLKGTLRKESTFNSRQKLELEKGVEWTVPTLLQLLNDERRRPLSKNDFRNYLKRLNCEAHLDFLTEVEIFVLQHSEPVSRAQKTAILSAEQPHPVQQTQQNEMTVSVSSPESQNANVATPSVPSSSSVEGGSAAAGEDHHVRRSLITPVAEALSHARLLCNTYLVENCPRPLSISADLCSDCVGTLARIEKYFDQLSKGEAPFKKLTPEEVGQALIEVFEDVGDVVSSAIKVGPYVLFIGQSLQNISPAEVNRRWGTMIFWGLITFLILAVCFELAIARWWRLVATIPMFWMFGYIASSTTGV